MSAPRVAAWSYRTRSLPSLLHQSNEIGYPQHYERRVPIRPDEQSFVRAEPVVDLLEAVGPDLALEAPVLVHHGNGQVAGKRAAGSTRQRDALRGIAGILEQVHQHALLAPAFVSRSFTHGSLLHWDWT